jgi:hypothetical protein
VPDPELGDLRAVASDERARQREDRIRALAHGILETGFPDGGALPQFEQLELQAEAAPPPLASPPIG